MNTIQRLTISVALIVITTVPFLSQTAQTPKPAFDVVSIKPSAPVQGGIRGGGARGNRFRFTGATLKMLLQTGYQFTAGALPGQLQIFGGPNWLDSDRYDIEATVDCGSGIVSRETIALMVQSMLEDRFQLMAHLETKDLPIYNLVLAREGSKLKPSADQTAPGQRGGPPQPCAPVPEGAVPAAPPPPPPPIAPGGGPDPNFSPPRGSLMMMMSPSGIVMQGTAIPITSMIGLLQQQTGRPIIDKTGLQGLFDYKMRFSPEGLNLPGPPPGALPPPAAAGPGGANTPATASEPLPSIFTALQEVGLKLEPAKGPVKVLVVDSVQKPKPN